MIVFGMYFVGVMACLYAYYCVRSAVYEYMFQRDMKKWNERKLRRIKGEREFDATWRDEKWIF